jgi:hypothetical protein
MKIPIAFAQLHWGRVLAAGLLAELLVFAVVFPMLYLFGQRAFLASILITSTLFPLIFAFWVGRRVESRFVLHGALVGLVGALFYTMLAWGQPQPLLYKVAHGLKVAGGMVGGALSRRRRAASQLSASRL